MTVESAGPVVLEQLQALNREIREDERSAVYVKDTGDLQLFNLQCGLAGFELFAVSGGPGESDAILFRHPVKFVSLRGRWSAVVGGREMLAGDGLDLCKGLPFTMRTSEKGACLLVVG